jgi:glutathione S-transferase
MSLRAKKRRQSSRSKDVNRKQINGTAVQLVETKQRRSAVTSGWGPAARHLSVSSFGVHGFKVSVDFRSTQYLRLNPLGTLPILTEGDAILCGAEAILAYLARKYDAARAWLPDEPTTFGQVMQWLGFAVSDLEVVSVARSHSLMGTEADEAVVERAARHAFRHMDDHTTKCEFDGALWFVGQAPTIADIALFSAFALSRDFGVDHDEYPALRRWMARMRKIPGIRHDAEHRCLSLIGASEE